jgi:signal transduction histidine kinase
MKTNILQIIIIGLMISTVITGCDKEDQENASYSRHEVLKQIVQINTTGFSTGINALFDTVLADSISSAFFCQTFLQDALFMDDGSGYLFVESLSGFNIAHPYHPELQGGYTMDQTDAHGNYIVRKMIDIVRYTGFGFLKYDYTNPANNLVESKTTFVTLIPYSNWYAGSGFYFAGNEPYFSNQEKSEKVVTEAVNFMGKGIAAILPEFSNDSLEGVQLMRKFLRNIRFFEDLSGYFFVLDYRGYNVVQPPEPEREGKYQWDMQDSRGNLLMRGLIAKAQEGGGFYSYYWIDYQTNTEKMKNAYVIPIPGYDYLIGSGVYYPD